MASSSITGEDACWAARPSASASSWPTHLQAWRCAVNGAPLAVLSVGNLVIGTGAFVLVGMLGAMAIILGISLRAFDGRR